MILLLVPIKYLCRASQILSGGGYPPTCAYPMRMGGNKDAFGDLMDVYEDLEEQEELVRILGELDELR